MRVLGIVCFACVFLIFGGFIPAVVASNSTQVAESDKIPSGSKSAIQAECDLTSAAQIVLTQAQVGDPESQSVNGPTIIRVPEWVKEPLGRYYLYFADHDGAYIKLAYSDSPLGPFTIYEGGVLNVASSPLLADHVASPEIFVADGERKIYLSFHSPDRSNDRKQNSYLASSADGLSFYLLDSSPNGYYLRGKPYLRFFEYEGKVYQILPRFGIMLSRSDSVTNIFEKSTNDLGLHKVRHLSVVEEGDFLKIYFTSIGDSPERIKRTTVDLRQPWGTWEAGPIECVRAPEETWEGATPCSASF